MSEMDAVLYLTCAGYPRRVRVEVQGPPEARRALAPLVGVLRGQRTWPDDQPIQLLVTRPDEVARAFRPHSGIVTAAQLEAVAGMQWLFPADWRRGVVPLHDWLAHVRVRLTEELRQRQLRRVPRAR